jgi:hypothetical protein
VVTNRSVAACFAVLSFAVQSCAVGQTANNDSVRMNQIQVIGTHNSYHAGLAPSEAKLMMAKNPNCIKRWNTVTVPWINNSVQGSSR